MTAALPFVDFCEQVLRLRFEGAQRAFYQVAGIGGEDPVDLEPSDRAIALELFGAVDRIPTQARGVVVGNKGAGIGWTTFIGARFVWRMLTADLSGRLAGDTAWCLGMGPDLEGTGELLENVVVLIEAVPSLRAMTVAKDGRSIQLRRPWDGAIVGTRIRAASAGGKGGRSDRWLEAALDETAFFRSAETGAVNDSDCFRAVAARVPDGTIWLGSTPWGRSGLLYEEFTRNWGAPRTALAALLPTELMRTDSKVRMMVARERERDPENASREFDCEFLSSDARQFFDEATLAKCVDDTLQLPGVKVESSPAYAGADFGFTRNSSTLAIVQSGRLVELLEERPAPGEPLRPSKVGARFKSELESWGCGSFAADGHYRESVKEHTEPAQFVDAPAGQGGKAEAYMAARTAMREGRILIPNHARLVKQLRQVVSKANPGGGVSISSPTWRTGEHGDLAAALVLALWLAESGGRHVPYTGAHHVVSERGRTDAGRPGSKVVLADGRVIQLRRY